MADLDPLCMSFWKVNPLLLTFYVRLEEGGRFIPCVCVCTDQIRYCTFLHIVSGVWQNFTCCYAICTEAEERCENGGKRLGEP